MQCVYVSNKEFGITAMPEQGYHLQPNQRDKIKLSQAAANKAGQDCSKGAVSCHLHSCSLLATISPGANRDNGQAAAVSFYVGTVDTLCLTEPVKLATTRTVAMQGLY